LREMLRLVKERCNDMARQNILAVVHRMLFKKRKEWNSVANSRDMATERS
jgi:hypothetical protein